MTWVKICGTTNLEDAQAAVEAGADALGFIFAPSPRSLTLERAREIIAELPEKVEKVGVFVNEPAERIREIAEQVGLTSVQLHGDESTDFTRDLALNSHLPQRLHVIKALAVRGGFGARMIAYAEQGHVGAVLLDSAGWQIRGGSGQVFDWQAVAEFLPRGGEDIRTIIAGGLNPSNVIQAMRILRPWGVDVCTGVEREPGKKDRVKVRAFVSAVRLGDRNTRHA